MTTTGQPDQLERKGRRGGHDSASCRRSRREPSSGSSGCRLEEPSTEQNKAMALRWSEELWSQGHLAVADEIVAPDYVRHDPGDPFPAQVTEDVKRIVRMLRSMLPAFASSVEAMVAEGDS